MPKQGSSSSRRASRMPRASRTSREPGEIDRAYALAEKYLEESSGLSRREQGLILKYVRLAFDALRNDRPLWAALRAGELGPDAMATALAILVTLTNEQSLVEPV